MDTETLDKLYSNMGVASIAIVNNDGDVYENHLPLTEEGMGKVIITAVKLKLNVESIGRTFKGLLLKSDHRGFMVCFFPDFIVLVELAEGCSPTEVDAHIRDTLESVTLEN